MGGGVDKFKYVCKKTSFYHTLLSMAMTFIAALKSTCYDYSPVSQIIYSLFLDGLIDWIFESFPIRNRGWGLNGKKYVRSWGIVESVRVRTMGDGGQMTPSRTIRGKKIQILQRGLSPSLKYSRF